MLTVKYPAIDTGQFAFGASGAKVKIDAGQFNDAYLPHLRDYARTQIYYGGSSSGKSVFLAQRCALDLVAGGRNYLVLRQVARTIRGSVYTEIVKAIYSLGLERHFEINKSDMLITCNNGCQIIFAGLDDVEKLKSLTPLKGVITDIWVEEATETERVTIKQLYKRQRGGDPKTPKRMTLSFNPVLRSHWIYEEFFKDIAWADDQAQYTSDSLSILKTTYRDNKFLTPEDVRDLESESDPYFYSVYTLGGWGVLGNVIFTNWSVADLSGMRDQFTNVRAGLDFGFAGDPAGFVMTHYDRPRQTVYVFAELYERGLTNPALAGMIRPILGSNYVTCDSAEPKSIRELQEHGIKALTARKGPDSVIFGIQWLQQQQIVIDEKCINARNEFASYKWREDKAGNAIRQPVDRNNHIIDGLRYAYEDVGLPRAAGLVDFA